MGTPEFAVPSLDVLNKNHEIVGIFTKVDKPNTRGGKIKFTPVKEYGLTHNIPVYQPNNLRDEETYALVKEINPNIAHFVTIKPVLYGGIASRFLNIGKKVFSISGLGFIFIKQGLKATLVRMLIKTMYKFALGGKNSHVIVQNPDDKAVVNSIVKIPITLIRGSGVDLSQYEYKEENNENIYGSSFAGCRFAGYPGSGPGKSGL